MSVGILNEKDGTASERYLKIRYPAMAATMSMAIVTIIFSCTHIPGLAEQLLFILHIMDI